MRLLIYGASVIGSLYAVLFAKAGQDTTVYARGKRLEALLQDGLRYKDGETVKKASVAVTGQVSSSDRYDFIFVTVREDQLHTVLEELRDNQSPTIVTMVNTLENYDKWEEICGCGRILPSFPGAGGGITDGVLDAALTPRLIQPTTFGEITGKKTQRLRKLAVLFRCAGIPCQIVPDMHVCQLCHLAMVVPLADAYYEAAAPEKVGQDPLLMRRTAGRLRQNFRTLRKMGFRLFPPKMNLFAIAPIPILCAGLNITYQSNFANMFMYQHAMKAPDEMRELHRQFYTYIGADP